MRCLPVSLPVAVEDFNYRKRGWGSQVPRQGSGATLTTPMSSINRRKRDFRPPTHGLCVKTLDARWSFLAFARPDGCLMTYM